MTSNQLTLFEVEGPVDHSSTFVSNMSLPVHRWYRYSAGFSARWVESVISDHISNIHETAVFDPFAGSATTLLAAEDMGVRSCGVESHPFVARIASAKLFRHSDPDRYRDFANRVLASAKRRKPSDTEYPDLIHRCYSSEHLQALDRIRTAYETFADRSPASELTWLTLISVLRSTSHAATAQWQYVLPNKSKKRAQHPFDAFASATKMFTRDMSRSKATATPATFYHADARNLKDIPDNSISLVITSPPYPNNYDYADATRLEMMLMLEIGGWSDLQGAVRTHLVRSCTQHTTTRNTDLDHLLTSGELHPIEDEVRQVVQSLSEIRQSKGGKKNYHLMIAAYFHDLAIVWHELRRVCIDGSSTCFVVGDSAPYGVYVPVHEWLGRLAIAAGFENWTFERIRDRNIKWKNRKHRVPLCEGRLWVRG